MVVLEYSFFPSSMQILSPSKETLDSISSDERNQEFEKKKREITQEGENNFLKISPVLIQLYNNKNCDTNLMNRQNNISYHHYLTQHRSESELLININMILNNSDIFQMILLLAPSFVTLHSLILSGWKKKGLIPNQKEKTIRIVCDTVPYNSNTIRQVSVK